ncbi:Phosphopantothenoylcysteine decarboxylase [Madurella mycetomatis]|uniref:Phosphopantothenoylcysteine decarboxylase n=1 Tax=Madurella mycetomatis TaxID=100816 RepID=A0A175WA01_9PEZI|nr:Phosphopantothenoylcysteine decarboxylase [Madurella mycetomatis]
MLQSVNSDHDNHYTRSQSNSIESLVAARNDGKKHLLLASFPKLTTNSSASGSVATIKSKSAALMNTHLLHVLTPRHEGELSIRIVLTEPATHFLNGQSDEQPTVSSLLSLPNVDAVYRDQDEWGPQLWRRGARADILVVAPLSANTLAKIVNGMADNLLTSVIRAWDTDSSIDMKKKIILVAPAMNSAMWRNPITDKHIRVLSDEWGVKEDLGVAGGARPITGWFQVLTASITCRATVVPTRC